MIKIENTVIGALVNELGKDILSKGEAGLMGIDYLTLKFRYAGLCFDINIQEDVPQEN